MTDLSKLSEPFPASEIEWRIGRDGKRGEDIWAVALAYVTSRAVMDRLDEVVGPGNWKAEYAAAPNDPDHKSLICTLSVRINNEWVGKSDGAQNTDIEGIKGGISDALKRAAVCWGIGRYLYSLGEGWCETSLTKQKDWRYQSARKNADMPAYYWLPPKLPSWAIPPGPCAPKIEPTATPNPAKIEAAKIAAAQPPAETKTPPSDNVCPDATFAFRQDGQLRSTI